MDQPKAKHYIGIKWGIENPTVMLAAEYAPPPRDHLHIIRELYEESFYFDDLLPIAKAWAAEFNVRKIFADPKEPEFIKRMRRQRLWAVAASEELALARNLIGKRVRQSMTIAAVLKGEHDPVKKELLLKAVQGGISFSQECSKTVQEFFRYRMPDKDPRKPFRDKPLEMDNFGIGALHFLVLGLAMEVQPRVRWL